MENKNIPARKTALFFAAKGQKTFFFAAAKGLWGREWVVETEAIC